MIEADSFVIEFDEDGSYLQYPDFPTFVSFFLNLVLNQGYRYKTTYISDTAEEEDSEITVILKK